MVNFDEEACELSVLEKYMDNLPYHIWIKDENHKYVYVNDCYLKTLNKDRSEVIGKTDFEIFSLYKALYLFKSEMKVLQKRQPLSYKNNICYKEKESYYDSYKAPLYENGKKESWIYCIEKEIIIHKNAAENMKQTVSDFKTGTDKHDKYYNRMVKIGQELNERLKSDGLSIMIYSKEKGQLNIFLNLCKQFHVENKHILQLSQREAEILETKLKNDHKINYAIKNENVMVHIYGIYNNDQLIGIVNIYYHNNIRNNGNQEDLIHYTCNKYSIILKNRFLSQNFNRELTKRKDSDDVLELFLETVADFCAVLRIKDNCYGYFEKITWKWMEISGYKKEEIYNQKAINFVYPEDKPYVHYLFDNRKRILNMRGMILRLRCKNNTYREIECNWRYLKAEDKIVITGKDVTTNNTLMAEKKRLTEKAHMEEIKTEFFSNMSHEFKTPLNIILSTVQLAAQKNDTAVINAEKAVNYMHSIRQNCYRLLRLVNNLIDTAKIEKNSLELNLINSNIVCTVEDVTSSVINYIRRSNKNIIFDTEEEDIIIAYDIEKIERIIFNLLSNALKNTSEDGNIYVYVYTKEDKVFISIKDDGVGIRQDMADFLFNKFTQQDYFLRRRHEGSGIGLFLVKSIIEMHKGTIDINKNVEKGTEIILSLPVRTIDEKDKSIYYSRSIDAQLEMCNVELSDIDI